MNKKTIKELVENNKNISKNFDIIKNVLNKYETEEKIKKEKNDEIERKYSNNKRRIYKRNRKI